MDNTPVELPVDVVQALVEIAARTPRGGALLSGIRVGLAASGRLPREVKCKIEVAPAFLVPAAE